MTGSDIEFVAPPPWDGPSCDPDDEQLGDVVSATTLEDAGGYRTVLVGAPTDRAVIGRKGAREGPDALRSELSRTKTHHLTRGPIGPLGDLGDIPIPDGSVSAIQNAIERTTRAVHELDARPVFLGGDNSITYPNARPLFESGSVGVVSFDAHFDCRSGDPSSGTPYRQLFEDGLDAFAVVGARHFENSTAYAAYVDERGTVITAEEVGADLGRAIQSAIDGMHEVDQLYVSLDLDVLDPPSAPGVSAPTPGGITTRELFRMLRIVGSDERCVGFEVVECAPPLDIGNRPEGVHRGGRPTDVHLGGRTATAGARAIAHVLSAWEVRDS